MEDGLQDGRALGPQPVIAGQKARSAVFTADDPAIHHTFKKHFFKMDTRIKPAYDSGDHAAAAVTTCASNASRFDCER